MARTGCQLATGGCLLWLVGSVGLVVLFVVIALIATNI